MLPEAYVSITLTLFVRLACRSSGSSYGSGFAFRKAVTKTSSRRNSASPSLPVDRRAVLLGARSGDRVRAPSGEAWTVEVGINPTSILGGVMA
jgi:hypothetical protein